MKSFQSIRFKKETVKDFQTFSRKFFKTHTEALQAMLDFFLYNEISPKESLGPNGRTITNLIKKRFNAMAAMMKNIEKQGILPTKTMLELLFEHSPKKKQEQAPLLLYGQDTDPERDMFFKKVEQALIMEKENTNLKRDLRQNRVEFYLVLKKLHLVKSSFGKPRLQLDMTLADFERLKMKIEKELH
ncbi:BfmA/BtgA family mobilization protein [Arenibacter latericius]|uniref:BfmA/BtgA family mobilization protein n=1 Tax=Arenibacter latericius TaxID=86104 RepID=UPI0004043587|nr:BfmA/BtgA family mobilization protein [Arenibacter latericius]